MRAPLDPVELAIFRTAFQSVAEEMGAALRRTAFSPNIKERRDYSSAVFDAAGQVIAMGDDMPVHLGSMPMSVRAALDRLTLEPDDIAFLNDPYCGGTHLPDITLVEPVFVDGRDRPAFYVANRAHHADVGGMYPGSMGLCREIWQEGIRIPPVKLVSRGVLNKTLLDVILANVRTPLEREGDLTAQIGACRIGEERLQEMVAKYGLPLIEENIGNLLDHSEAMIRGTLRELPSGEFTGIDYLDNDGIGENRVKIAVRVNTSPQDGSMGFDFSESDDQVQGSLNAVEAITYSAVFYVLRCLLPEDASRSAGIMRPITVKTRRGSVLAATIPAAVAGGNVETSQRIVDVLLRALAQAMPDRIPAASSGTMNNLTIGGVDPRSGNLFAYYETIAGGAGALPNRDGASGVHTHMTNSLNTPVEALEYAYPFRVRRYAVRKNSGGAGKYRGGDGLIREIELLAPVQITILSDRRELAPYGLAGGGEGARGRNMIIEGGSVTELPSKCNRQAEAGSVVRIETPGGGAWGRSDS